MANKKNVSSGAEKAEKLALANKSGTTRSGENKGAKKDKSSVKSEGAKKNKGKNAVKQTKKKTEKKHEKRVQLRAERKQKRQERRLAHKEHERERRARLLEKKQERKQKKLELKEQRKQKKALLKSESKQQRQKRIAEEKKAKREAKAAKREAYLADKKAKREHALKVRAEKRAARRERGRTPGVGGWLAAVITLGVTTLALGTVVTFGAMTMNDMQVDMASGYTQSLYELNAIIDDLDTDLARAQVTNSANDRVRVLSDIAIESRTAETVLERFPLELQLTEQLTSFVNKMGDSARDMLYTVANGGELSSSQIKTLEYMYNNNKKLKEEINRLTSECEKGDMLCLMRGKEGKITQSFTLIQNDIFTTPEGIEEGAFSKVKKKGAAYVERCKEISAQRAEELAKQYFKGYKVSEAHCTGEAVASSLTLYNVNLTTPDGDMLVQLSKKGGKVVAFDSYKDCSSKNFSIERCTDIAADFLNEIGYGRLEPVWASENGVSCNLTFAPVIDGAVIYTDKIKVKVCEERGIVTGVEAIDFVMNHAERELTSPSIGKEQAKESINGNMKIVSSRKAVIPMDGKEILCYEFIGEAGDGQYYVYVDATTGEEVEVLTVVGTATGRALK